MKRIGLLIVCLAMLAFVLPSLTAQDGKKDDAKKQDAKKDADKSDKKDDPAKDDKKDPEKKTETKKTPEKLVYGNKFISKIVSMNGESSREFSIEINEVDPQKVAKHNAWLAQRSQELARQQFQASTNRDANARIQGLAAHQRDYAAFQIEAAKRASNLTSPRALEVRAADSAKVRTLFPPVEFDDLGFQKKWTKKELDERRDKTGLPGFAVDFDALKQGQFIEIYMAKQVPMKKTPTKKKGPDGDDTPAAKMAQEFVLIVIRQEPSK